MILNYRSTFDFIVQSVDSSQLNYENENFLPLRTITYHRVFKNGSFLINQQDPILSVHTMPADLDSGRSFRCPEAIYGYLGCDDAVVEIRFKNPCPTSDSLNEITARVPILLCLRKIATAI